MQIYSMRLQFELNNVLDYKSIINAFYHYITTIFTRNLLTKKAGDAI